MERAGYAELASGESRSIEAEVAVSILAKESSVIRLITPTGYMRLSIESGQTITLGPLYIVGVYVESGRIALYYAPRSITLTPTTSNLDVPLSTRASEATLSSIDSKIDVPLSMTPILTPYPLTNQTARFTGAWSKNYSLESPTGYTWYSNDTSTPASVEVIFRGKRFVVALLHGPDKGIANIYVDGNLIDQVDLYDTIYNWRQHYYELDSDGEHTLKIEVSGQKNDNSSGYTIVIGGLYFEGDKNINTPFVRQFEDMRLRLVGLRETGVFNPYFGVLTTTPLRAGSSFVSSWEDMKSFGFSYIIVTIYADTETTVTIEQSHDPNTIIHVDSFIYQGNRTTDNVLKAQIVARYVRVRVENDSSSDQRKLIVTRRYSMA